MFKAIVIVAFLSLLYRLKFQYPVLYNTNYNMHSTPGSFTFPIRYPENVTSGPTTKAITIPSKYQPSKFILYDRSGQNDDRSVFVVPRRVYYDTRVHKGKPRNVILILAEVHDNAVKTVEACELNGYFSESISVIKENTGWVRAHKRGFSHCAILVECKGLPPKSLVNGSYPKLIYKRYEDRYHSFVESEMPLILKIFQSIPEKGKGSAVVCTTMYGHPVKFNHWLKYQNLIGVDKVHLNTDQTFLDNSSVLYPYLNESLNTGFLQVEVWNNTLDKRVYYYGQVTKYQDCIFRHINIFDYVLIYDYDDYFNPMISDQKDIHFYLKQFFSKSNTGSVLMPWRQMNCRPTEEKCKTLQDGNLTSILSGPGSTERSSAKCAHRVNALMFIMVHSYQKLLSGYTSIMSSDKLAYVAHNRHNNKLCTT